jgi:hypothetical protein
MSDRRRGPARRHRDQPTSAELVRAMARHPVRWSAAHRLRDRIDWHRRGSVIRALCAQPSPVAGSFYGEPGLAAAVGGPRRRETPALRWSDLSRSGIRDIAAQRWQTRPFRPRQHPGTDPGAGIVRADVNPDEGLHRFTYALYPHPAIGAPPPEGLPGSISPCWRW